MNIAFFAGVLIVILLIVSAGLLSGRKVKSVSDFSIGGDSGTLLTIGALMTTLLGGNATIGTAQLAYVYGLSGWWFSIGASLACVLLIFITSDKIRHSGEPTLGSIIGKEFGGGVRTLSALCIAAGSMLNIITQLLCGTAIMEILLPDVSPILQTVCVAILVLLYIVFGGVKSAGMVGVVKTGLMFPTVLFCGVLAYKICGGSAAIFSLPQKQYFNLFARGAATDAGAGISTALGVLSSQAYATAILGAKNDRTARKALWIAAGISPFLGIGGILVGMSMRLQAPSEIISNPSAMAAAAKTAFPSFVLEYCPAFIAGIILATLLIAAAGTSAGLLLSAGTVFHNDLVNRVTDRYKSAEKGLRFSRICLLVLLAVCVILSLIPTSFIIDLGFLSLGLRAAAALAPLLAAMYFPGKASKLTAMSCILAGLLVTVLVKTANLPMDSSSAGTLVSLMIMGITIMKKHNSAS